jgi:SET domain-containing protein
MKPSKLNYEIKPSAAGSGLGFFTLVPIPEDKKIIEYTGVILTDEEAEQADARFLMALIGDYFIDGSPETNAARYINHSCEPNAKAYRTGVRVWIRSIRAIEAGEEITYDYGKKYFNDFIKPLGCKCIKCIKTLETNK